MEINLFWVIVAAVNFIVFLMVIWALFFTPVSTTLETRRQRIEQGLKDADLARQAREEAVEERQSILLDARREATDVIARAQHLAEEAHAREVEATRAEIDRMREQAVAEIESERQRAIADVRAQVAELALLAAGKVVGETMTGQRERRLVDEFLAEVAASASSGGSRN